MLIINDGSKDNTDKILSKYIECSKLVINYIIQDNKGIECSRGKYIVFLDADDIYNKNFIDVMYNNIDNTNFDVVICGYDRNIERVRKLEINQNFTKKEMIGSEILDFFIFRKGPSSFFTIIYKKRNIR